MSTNIINSAHQKIESTFNHAHLTKKLIGAGEPWTASRVARVALVVLTGILPGILLALVVDLGIYIANNKFNQNITWCNNKAAEVVEPPTEEVDDASSESSGASSARSAAPSAQSATGSHQSSTKTAQASKGFFSFITG